jgi:hypothetical protein
VGAPAPGPAAPAGCSGGVELVDAVDERADEPELVAGVGEDDAGQVEVVSSSSGPRLSDLSGLDEDAELVVECLDVFVAQLGLERMTRSSRT